MENQPKPSDQIPENTKLTYLLSLKEKGADLPCPRCASKKFIMLDRYFNLSMSGAIGTVILGGPTIPSIVTVCSNCGFLSQHAVGALGLLPADQEDKK